MNLAWRYEPNGAREINEQMEAILLLGLAFGTIGLLLLAHGIFGKTPHDGLIMIAILLGASMLIALMLIMWTRSFSPLAFGGSVFYGLFVLAFWGIGKPATPTVRGLVSWPRKEVPWKQEAGSKGFSCCPSFCARNYFR